MKKALLVLGVVAVFGIVGSLGRPRGVYVTRTAPALRSIEIYRRELAQYKRWMAHRRLVQARKVKYAPFHLIPGKGVKSG